MTDTLLQVGKRKHISLASISSQIDIKEGDYMAVEVVNGAIMLKPVGIHEKSQEYFWTPEFQEKMKKSVSDLHEGRYQTFNSLGDVADFIEKGTGDDKEDSSDTTIL